MAAMLVENTDASGFVAKDNKVLVQDFGGQGQIRELFAQAHRVPKSAHVFAHRCPVRDSSQFFVGRRNLSFVITAVRAGGVTLSRPVLLN